MHTFAVVAVVTCFLASNAAAGEPVSAQEARATALDFATKLENGYLDPAIGAGYAAALRARANAGAYDSAVHPERFAEVLTQDVQAIHPDLHLRVTVREAAMGSHGGDHDGHSAHTRAAFGEPKWIDGDIAYTEWFMFPGTESALNHARAIMKDYAAARAIIFDMRGHRGGGAAETDVFFSYLFAEPTHLLNTTIREGRGSEMAAHFDASPTLHRKSTDNGLLVWEHWTQPAKDGVGAWADKPVYVLVSKVTASSAEAFSMALKISRRGVLIGEQTRGAGNFGIMERVGDRFMAFMPVGTAINPDTGNGWEGTGVAPDVVTAPDQALSKALELIGQQIVTQNASEKSGNSAGKQE